MVQKREKLSLGSLMAEGTSETTASESAVLTPTTTKIITQILESQDLNKLSAIENDGFLVPLPPVEQLSATPSGNKAVCNNNRKSFVKLDSKSWQGGTTTVVTPTKSENLTFLDVPTSVSAMKTRSSTRTLPRLSTEARAQVTPVVTPRRQANVRRTPKLRPGVKAVTNDEDLSPEDAEKLRVRRERNKQAAARCRKRRMDQIDTLSNEVKEHEAKKRALEHTIAQLKDQMEELHYILAQHQAECNLNIEHHAIPVAVKSEPVIVEPLEQLYVEKFEIPTPVVVHTTKKQPKRPLSLNIESANAAKVSSSVEGVLIDTPSNIIANLGFDALMTSTGLTPTTNVVTPVSFLTTPSCSSQQRSSEAIHADLNTPATENVSLVSL